MNPIITLTVLLLLAENVRMETCASIKQLPIIDLKTKLAVDIQKDCGNFTKPCVMKCCPENEVLYKIPYKKFGYLCKNLKVLSKEYTPAAIQNVSDYSTIPLFNDSYKKVSLFDDYRILYSDRFVNKPCTRFQFRAYLSENGTAYWYSDSNNSPWQRFAPEFCMDRILGLSRNASGGLTSVYAYHFRIDDPSSSINITLFHAYGGLVSAFFLLLVFVVHCLLKILHGNLKGKLLMNFVFNMMLYFVYNVWYSFNTLEHLENSITTGNILPACKWVSPIGYYLLVSAFFWMNAMCYDIWRKFRSSKLKSTDDKKKMLLYSAYAVGIPLLCTVICVLMDQYGPERARPGFDNYCYQDNENNVWKRLYIRIPTGLVVLSNVVMWVLTVRNVRRVRVAFTRTARKDSTHTRKGEKLSNVYRKLFLLMGLNWLIEIVVTPIPNFTDGVYYMVIVPNTLLGVWIFIVTVCNKEIFIMLCRRFGIKNKWTQNSNTTQVSQMPSTSRPKDSNKAIA